MSSLQTSSFLDHTGDVGFRAWASEFSNSLSAIGLIQTSDTGQINLTTATKSASGNTNAGYQIWRFNDATQSTKPIFIKIFYGNGSSATSPRLLITVGTGSDGAGNLINSSSSFTFGAGGPASTVTNYISNFSLVNSNLVIAWKIGAFVGSAAAMFAICRSCDANGDPDDLGFTVYSYGGGTQSVTEQLQTRRSDNTWSTFIAGASGTPTALIPTDSTAPSFVGSDAQVVLHFGAFPRIQPITGLLCVKASEFGEDSTFTAAPVGTTLRTFLVLGQRYSGNGGGAFCYGYNNTIAATGWTIAMIWEP